ncbi:MAG: hypothetical protein OXH06_12680 [Gemmatimonadetes bacterium]|nr:hypothetical protein [Gemmatimonadota bacterium]
MATINFTLPTIEEAIRDVCNTLEERPAVSWRNHSEDELWRELVSCILGSRVRIKAVNAAIERMNSMCLLTRPQPRSCFNQLEEDTLAALAGGYPFFRVRANQIRRAAEHIYISRGSILSLLNDLDDVSIARRLLVREVPGLGPKQASLFLRNICFAKYIAILDVHILAYLHWVGITDSSLKSISNLRKYEALEGAFIEQACAFGYSPDQFDLAVWIVIRVAKEESKLADRASRIGWT